MDFLAVFFGGGIGASLRFLATVFGKKYIKNSYWITFLINITGCIFLGFITFYCLKHQNVFNSKINLLLTTGIAGGFTTFSTFSLENIELLQSGEVLKSIIYMSLSLLTGIIGIYTGFIINCLMK